MEHVRVCGIRRFQRGLDDITKAIADHGILADLSSRDIVELQAQEGQDQEDAREMRRIGQTSSSTATLDTSNMLKLSRSTKTAHDIPRTGLRSWLLRRRSRISLRATSLISGPSIHLKTLHIRSILSVVVQPRSSFPRGESSGSRAAPRKRTSPTLPNSTANASAALWSAKTATLPTSPSDVTPA